MKNILIISKLSLFKLQPSDNRYYFLNYLSLKKNIKIMNDDDKYTLNRWLKSTYKRMKWKPDIIIYYFLSRHERWLNIDIKDFNTASSNVPRYMIFEDHHYSDIVIQLYNKYRFTKFIKPSVHLKSEVEYKKNGIDYSVWGFYYDTKNFKNWRMDNKFDYDILLYGFINQAYPLRKKMYEVCKYLQNNNTTIKVKVIEHPGYADGKSDKMPKNVELSKIISKSRFTFVSSSFFKLKLKKYDEVPLSGSTIIGDIPEGNYEYLNDKIIKLDFDSSHNDILKVLLDALQNKYLHIEENSKKWSVELNKTLDYENGYDKLMTLV